MISAKQEIAFHKIKGFRPIGIGESSTRIQGKTINLFTGEDVKYECNVDQLSSGAKTYIAVIICYGECLSRSGRKKT